MLKEKRMVNIYALINPINNNVFYIGASYRPKIRLIQHNTLRYKSEKFHHKQLRIIKESGLEAEILILETCNFKEVSFFEEFYMDLFASFGFHIEQLRHSQYSGGTKDYSIPKFSIQHTKRNTIIAKIETSVGGSHSIYKVEVNKDEYNEEEVKKILYAE